MLAYKTIFLIFIVIFILAIDTQNPLLVVVSLITIFALFLVVHVYITALCHMASVISVLDLIYRYATRKKSYELLKGKTRVVAVMVFCYQAIFVVISGVFGAVVVHDGVNHEVFTRIVVGGFLVGVLVIMNLVVGSERVLLCLQE
ncbi:hypothetical protein LINPERPRIM_LOCUS20654 [Linum perenne]